MVRKLSVLLFVALAGAGLLWGVLFACHPKGFAARVFFERGTVFFGDFACVRTCADWGYMSDKLAAYDACYPALGAVLARPFPPEAGALFTGVGIALFLLAFAVALGRLHDDWRRSSALTVLALLGVGFSSIMLHAFEWGNQILYAAAAVALFVAWWDAPSRARRLAAALALAVAAVLKISPALLALLYVLRFVAVRDDLAERRRVALDFAVFALAGLVLFVVPFAGYGGWAGFCAWFSNAAANAAHYAHKGAWGFVPLGRTVRILLHQDVSQPWAGLTFERALGVALGLVCLARAEWISRAASVRRGDLLLLLVAALLLIPGNMHVYTGLYLLPVLAVRIREGMGWFEAACWFALLVPIPIPLGAGNLNHPLANLAFLALVVRSLWTRGKGGGEFCYTVCALRRNKEKGRQ